MRKLRFTPVFSRFLGAVLCLGAFSTAAYAENCPVPVCDVDAYVTELRESTMTQREQKVLKDFPAFAHDNRKSQDAAIWQNLADVAEKTRALALELEDADYVVREASNLIDLANLGVHRYGPLTLENLITTYKKLSSSGRRFEALSTWENLEREPSLAKVQVLVEFTKLAVEHSRSLEDADWVILKAQDIMRSASARVVALDPIAEGYYSVRLIAKEGTDPLICPEYDHIDTLMIANWLTSEGLVASLMSREHGMHVAYFKNMVISDAGTRIRGKALSRGTAVNMTLDLDKESGRVTGRFHSTRTTCSYDITGQRLHSPGEYLRDGVLDGIPQEIDLKNISGVYDAKLIPEGKSEEEALAGRMVIRPYLQANGSVLAASFMFSGILMDFQYGYFSKEGAFVIMNSGTGEYHLIRWDLAYRPDENGEWNWQGRMYSFINGRRGVLKLKKIADYVEDPDDFEP